MQEAVTIWQLLQGGSDIAIIAFAWAIWRLERRVYQVEFKLENIFNTGG